MKRYAEIIGWGKYLPQQVVTNDDLARTIDTSDRWIREHTGIRERRIAGPGETSVAMGAAAARAALAVAELKPTDVDLIIFSSYTPDYQFPGGAPMLQKELGATHAAAFDLRAGCPGFLFGVSVASQFIANGVYRRVLVVAAEVVSQFVNWQDRRSCVLFGDGAGAVVLEASTRRTGVLHTALGTQGADYDAMIFRGAGSRHPITAEPFSDELRFLQTDGQRVLNFAVRTVTTRLKQELVLGGAEMEDIALVIPQQSNLNFMHWLCKKLGFPTERVFVNVERYANTSSASIAIALCEAFEQGRINEGDDVLLLSFGAGLNWASVLVRCGVREGEDESSVEPATILAGVQHMLRHARAMAEVGVSNLTSAVSLALLPFFTRSSKK